MNEKEMLRSYSGRMAANRVLIRELVKCHSLTIHTPEALNENGMLDWFAPRIGSVTDVTFAPGMDYSTNLAHPHYISVSARTPHGQTMLRFRLNQVFVIPAHGVASIIVDIREIGK